MMFLKIAKDGGRESHVWGYFLLEIKRLVSVVLLRFEHGTRDAHHSHAFHSVSWLLRGCLVEHHHDTDVVEVHFPSWRPIITRRSTTHKVFSVGRSWVLSFRGPWARTWDEIVKGARRRLGHGRTPVGVI